MVTVIVAEGESYRLVPGSAICAKSAYSLVEKGAGSSRSASTVKP